MFCFFFFRFSFAFCFISLSLLLLSRFFFRFLLHFALALLFSWEMLCFYSLRGDATKRKTTNNKHTNKDRNISHKNCREDSMQVSCCFYLQTNSLSPHPRILFFATGISVLLIINNTKREGKNVLLSIRHTIYESVYKTQTKRGKPLQKGIVIVQ
jgi:hypothetical protein